MQQTESKYYIIMSTNENPIHYNIFLGESRYLKKNHMDSRSGGTKGGGLDLPLPLIVFVTLPF